MLLCYGWLHRGRVVLCGLPLLLNPKCLQLPNDSQDPTFHCLERYACFVVARDFLRQNATVHKHKKILKFMYLGRLVICLVNTSFVQTLALCKHVCPFRSQLSSDQAAAHSVICRIIEPSIPRFVYQRFANMLLFSYVSLLLNISRYIYSYRHTSFLRRSFLANQKQLTCRYS